MYPITSNTQCSDSNTIFSFYLWLKWHKIIQFFYHLERQYWCSYVDQTTVQDLPFFLLPILYLSKLDPCKIQEALFLEQQDLIFSNGDSSAFLGQRSKYVGQRSKYVGQSIVGQRGSNWTTISFVVVCSLSKGLRARTVQVLSNKGKHLKV